MSQVFLLMMLVVIDLGSGWGFQKMYFITPKKLPFYLWDFVILVKVPPRSECAVAWRSKLLEQLPQLQLTLVIGQYAQSYHFPSNNLSVTERVHSWKNYWPNLMPLPHPSPRNNIWLKKNSWFESEVLPSLRERVSELL